MPEGGSSLWRPQFVIYRRKRFGVFCKRKKESRLSAAGFGNSVGYLRNLFLASRFVKTSFSPPSRGHFKAKGFWTIRKPFLSRHLCENRSLLPPLQNCAGCAVCSPPDCQAQLRKKRNSRTATSHYQALIYSTVTRNGGFHGR